MTEWEFGDWWGYSKSDNKQVSARVRAYRFMSVVRFDGAAIIWGGGKTSASVNSKSDSLKKQ